MKQSNVKQPKMKQSKKLMFVATLACLGCCAIPVYALIAGVAGSGLAAVMDWKSSDLLICILPLLVIAVYLFIKRNKDRKVCCSRPSDQCSDTQCDCTKTH